MYDVSNRPGSRFTLQFFREAGANFYEPMICQTGISDQPKSAHWLKVTVKTSNSHNNSAGSDNNWYNSSIAIRTSVGEYVTDV
jgi:hypothetical protein